MKSHFTVIGISSLSSSPENREAAARETVAIDREPVAQNRGAVAQNRETIAQQISKPACRMAFGRRKNPLPSFYLFFTDHALWIKARQSHNRSLDCAFGAQGKTRLSKIEGQPAAPLEAGGDTRTRLPAPAIPFPVGERAGCRPYPSFAPSVQACREEYFENWAMKSAFNFFSLMTSLKIQRIV